MCGLLRRMVITTALLLVTQVRVSYGEYSVVDLGKDLTPTAVNDVGEVVGFIAAASGQHAFLYNGGRLRDLGTFNGTSSEANAINNKGQIIGHMVINGVKHPFLLKLTQLTDLFTTAAIVKAIGINDSGTVLGQIRYPATTRTEHSVLLQEGVITDITQQGIDQGILDRSASSYGIAMNALGEVIFDQSLCPGLDCTRHLFYSSGTSKEMFRLFKTSDINDKGQVIGSAPSQSNPSLTDVFIYEGGSVTVINALPTYRMEPKSINNSGQVVGDAYGTPFIYTDGTMSNLSTMLPKDTPWTITQVNGINDRGQIIGVGSLDGESHGFILLPVSSTVTMTVTITGAGSGTVTSDPAGIACSSDSTSGCSSEFDAGSTVRLMATPSAGSLFSTWSGSISSSATDAVATMDGDKAVTATFNPAPKVLVGLKGFATLQEAYDDAGTVHGSVIKLVEKVLPGPFTAGRNIAVKIEGGYNATFDSRVSTTILQAPLRLQAGTVTVREIRLKSL